MSGMLIDRFTCVTCDRHMGLQQIIVAPVWLLQAIATATGFCRCTWVVEGMTWVMLLLVCGAVGMQCLFSTRQSLERLVGQWCSGRGWLSLCVLSQPGLSLCRQCMQGVLVPCHSSACRAQSCLSRARHRLWQRHQFCVVGNRQRSLATPHHWQPSCFFQPCFHVKPSYTTAPGDNSQ